MNSETMAYRPFELKAQDDSARTFEGLSAAYSLDSVGDVIHPGAFRRTLDHWKQSGRLIPLLDQHANMINPTHSVTKHTLGKMVEAEETTDGLWSRFKVAATAAGDDLMALLRDGMVKGLSIGYTAINPERKDGVRHLREVKLSEVSVVTFGANKDALVNLASVKSMDVLTAAIRAGTLTEEQKAELRALLDPAPADDEPAPQAKGLAPDDPMRLELDAMLRDIELRRLAAV